MASYTQEKDSTSFATEAPPSRAAPEYTHRDDPPHRSFGLVDILLRVFSVCLCSRCSYRYGHQQTKDCDSSTFSAFPDSQLSRVQKLTSFHIPHGSSNRYRLVQPYNHTRVVACPPKIWRASCYGVPFCHIRCGIVSAATGAAGAVAYIGLKGNSHTQWLKICNRFDIFCKHIGASVALSLGASVILALLVLRSVLSLSKRIPK